MKNPLKKILLSERNKVYNVNELDKIFVNLIDTEWIKDKKNIYYANIPISFDIETSSFKIFNKSNQLDEKIAIMYEWSFCIFGYIVVGRTWNEFEKLYSSLVNFFNLYENKRIIIYIQNLSYEFQFIRKRLNWLSVFSIDERKPLKAVTIDGVEFRCSYMLSGYSLDTMGKNLTKYKVNKLVGFLDYSKLRTSDTILTDKEMQYCINDVLVDVCYIQEQIEKNGDITNIPLTKTGFVRNYTRKMCLYGGMCKRDNDQYHSYRKLMQELQLSEKVYKLAKDAFAGGFTHANAYWVNEIVHDVKSYDFTSSYPYVLVSEKFPMSKFKKVKVQSIGQFENYIKNYCCLFICEFFDIETIFEYENYISKSHCRDIIDCEENNGRIVRAKHIKITVTEQDYLIIKKLYKWSNINISSFHISMKQYLPTNFVLSILQKYVDKTELKGVLGKEEEYMSAKETVNAEYGMTVTDPCRDEIIYDNKEWSKEQGDISNLINKYNKSVKRFLYYPWGIWVTAYARRNLFSAILEFKNDYLYADTDSVKVINYEKHINYIDKYNKLVLLKLQKAMNYHKIDFNMTCPINIKGEKKQLGIWDDEGIYTRFKTLGAKRYIVEKDNEINITVSGVNKKIAVPYLIKKYKDKIFENFNNGLYIPAEFTGKLTHTYIDERRIGKIKDYQGHISEYDELSAVHLEPASYDMSLSEKFVSFLLDIKQNLK